MTGRALGTALMLLWLLVLVQSAVMSWLPLPLGALAPAVVLGLSLAQVLGPMPGALLGAWVGLGMDLMPPAAGPVGSWALILALVGAGLGQVSAARAPGPWLTLGLIGLATAAATGLRVVLLWFAGATPAAGDAVAVAASASLGALLLAPIALPVALRLCGRGRPRSRRSPLLLPGTAAARALERS